MNLLQMPSPSEWWDFPNFFPLFFLLCREVPAADRIERRTILLCCFSLQVVTALLLLCISLLPTPRAGWIFPVIWVTGVVQAFLGAASQSLVPFLVPREDFPRAVAWNSTIAQVATIPGPAVGGLLYAFGPTRGAPAA